MIDYIIYLKNNYGDIASVIGLIVSIVGFIFTILIVYRSKKAAEQAQIAANLARNEIIKSNTVAEFSSAISAMGEIRRLQRQKAWEILPERYSALKKSLISIKATNPCMSQKYKKILQDAIVTFSSIEEQIERLIISDGVSIDIARLNTSISRENDKLQGVLEEIKSQIRR